MSDIDLIIGNKNKDEAIAILKKQNQALEEQVAELEVLRDALMCSGNNQAAEIYKLEHQNKKHKEALQRICDIHSGKETTAYDNHNSKDIRHLMADVAEKALQENE